MQQSNNYKNYRQSNNWNNKKKVTLYIDSTDMSGLQQHADTNSNYQQLKTCNYVHLDKITLP